MAESRQKYKKLEEEVAGLQRRCRELKIPVMVVFEGLSAAGKGTLINRIIQPMDPRGFKVTCISDPTSDELSRPFLWRFWRRTPSADRMAIFDRAWYRSIIDGQVNGSLGKEALAKAYTDIRAFERQFKDGGTLIIKFHLHISKEVQHQRLEELRANQSTAWRVTDEVLLRHQRHDQYCEAIERMFLETDLPDTPWEKIDAVDLNIAAHKVLERFASSLRERVKAEEKGKDSKPNRDSEKPPKFTDAPSLKKARLENTLAKEDYFSLLDERQAQIRDLQSEAYRRRIPVVIVYEGQDAAGKGGNIRRLTQQMDPRGYEVIPVSAPNVVEKAHHYLWRFWTEFPKAGHVTIFDRSWYGRVLVERVEGFCTKGDWRRAFREINEMEENFHHFGAIILKFWIQISNKEQLNRFRARENDPRKSWKLNEEDWRNREKWANYEEAVEEMFLRTHAPNAPWTIIEGNCKRHARIQALDAVIAAISSRL